MHSIKKNDTKKSNNRGNKVRAFCALIVATWISIKKNGLHLRIQLASPPDHWPSAWQYLVDVNVVLYPLLQLYVAVLPTRLPELRATLPLDGLLKLGHDSAETQNTGRNDFKYSHKPSWMGISTLMSLTPPHNGFLHPTAKNKFVTSRTIIFTCIFFATATSSFMYCHWHHITASSTQQQRYWHPHITASSARPTKKKGCPNHQPIRLLSFTPPHNGILFATAGAPAGTDIHNPLHFEKGLQCFAYHTIT